MKIKIRNNTNHAVRYSLADGSVIFIKSRGFSEPIDNSLLTSTITNAQKMGKVVFVEVKEVVNSAPNVTTTTVTEEATARTMASKGTKKKTTEGSDK